MPKKSQVSTPIESVKHQDKRTNIPTEELRDFMPEEEKTPKKSEKEQQLSLFNNFNGLEFEQLIDFYQHQDGVNWANCMILGDSLLVMASLAGKEGLKGKV